MAGEPGGTIDQQHRCLLGAQTGHQRCAVVQIGRERVEFELDHGDPAMPRLNLAHHVPQIIDLRADIGAAARALRGRRQGDHHIRQPCRVEDLQRGPGATGFAGDDHPAIPGGAQDR